MKNKLVIFLYFASIAVVFPLDIELTDGSRIHGEIEGPLTVIAGFGVVILEGNEIEDISFGERIEIRLKDGSSLAGKIRGNLIRIRWQHGLLELSTNEIEKITTAALRADEPAPESSTDSPLETNRTTIGDIEFASLPGGLFIMGGDPDEPLSSLTEYPRHRVNLTPLRISTHEITREQFSLFLSESGYTPEGEPNQPTSAQYGFAVSNITLADAKAFCAWFSAKHRVTARLPTEAEWEYAARGGLDGREYPLGDSITREDANIRSYAPERTGGYPPNGFGLYDMDGNVAEYTGDFFSATYYAESPLENPVGPAESDYTVVRGGDYYNGSSVARVAKRRVHRPADSAATIGFRVVIQDNEFIAGINPEFPELDGSLFEVSKFPAGFTVPDDFVFIDGGTFTMGRNDTGYLAEYPEHEVTVSSFYMKKHELTQAEYARLTGKDLSWEHGIGIGNNRPVTMFWSDAVKFCNTLSEANGLQPAYSISEGGVSWNRNANGFRLPTEAEWEYAAKGGSRSRSYRYAGSDDAQEVAWFNGNAGWSGMDVGLKKPNELGLFDMSGNASEWCWDYQGYYKRRKFLNPAGPETGEYRVSRGGTYDTGVEDLAVELRNVDVPTTYGYLRTTLRLVLPDG